MADLRRWALIAVAVLLSSLILLCVALNVPYGLQASRYPNYSGTSPSEYMEGMIPVVLISGTIGLLALLLASLCWILALGRAPVRHDARNSRLMVLTLVLLPLCLALAFPLLVVLRYPDIFRIAPPGG